MAADGMVLPVLAVIFLATLIRSAFGFGEALVGVPLLALLIPVEVAVPLAVLLSVTVGGMIVVQDWRQVHVRSAWWLVLSSFLGIPCGLALLSLPGAVAAVFLGRALNRRMQGPRFLICVHTGLILVGLALGLQGVWR